MELSNTQHFILRMAILVSITFTALILLGEARLDVYISLYILIYYILLALHSPFNRRISRRLNVISVVLFIIFMVIVALRVIAILFPSVLA
jgi:hypothetical protein